MLGSLRWASSLHNCGEQLVTTFCCCLVGSFCFEISPLKKKANSVPLSAPQRPITTHRTTATPKAGPGVVRKNPGVGNGDDEAAELMQQVNVLKLTVEDLEKERDFYFGKLRNIELICQENEGENNPVLQRIVDILYATDVCADLGVVSCHFAT